MVLKASFNYGTFVEFFEEWILEDFSLEVANTLVRKYPRHILIRCEVCFIQSGVLDHSTAPSDIEVNKNDFLLLAASSRTT